MTQWLSMLPFRIWSHHHSPEFGLIQGSEVSMPSRDLCSKQTLCHNLLKTSPPPLTHRNHLYFGHSNSTFSICSKHLQIYLVLSEILSPKILQKFKGWTPDWEVSVRTPFVPCNLTRPYCHTLTLLSSGRCIETKWTLFHLKARAEMGEGKRYSSTPIEGPPSEKWIVAAYRGLAAY